MPLRNNPQRYGYLAQSFHWGIAALVVLLFGLAWYMDDLPLGPEKSKFYNLHKSLGITVFTLAALRLLWRWISPPPPLPGGISDWERRAAKASHLLLYLVLFLQPLLGVLGSWAANFPIIVFGWFTIPALTAPSETMKEFWGALHAWTSYVIFLLVLVHAGAALRHHFALKDNVLQRMLPGAGK